MLSRADAEVARRDPGLPGLPTLLNAEAMADRLGQALPGASGLQVKPAYVRYKPGTSCLVAYEVRQAGRIEDFYAKAYTAGSPKLLKRAAYAEEATDTRCITAVWGDIATLVASPAYDRDLKGLAQLYTPHRRHGLLRRLFPEQPEFRDVRIERLRYKPERRFVARLITSQGASAVIKIYTKDDFHHARLGALLAAAQQVSPSAALLAESKKLQALIFQWANGQTLYERLRAGSLDDATVERLGDRLLQLHLQAAPDARLPWLTIPVITERLAAAAQSVATVCPSLAEQAALLVRHIGARLQLSNRPARSGLIHGDFKPDQVICVGDTIALLDFDQASHGDYAADLGTFAAQMERGALLGEWSMTDINRVMARLISRYAHLGDPSLDYRVRLYTAAGLLLLAPHEFRNRVPNWIETTGAILDRSERLISHAG